MMPLKELKRTSECEHLGLVAILIFFVYFAGYIAVSLRTGIMPDEHTHFNFVLFFAESWGVPQDTTEIIKYGVFLQTNPYFYYWILGRATNLIHLFAPNMTDLALLSSLRLINVMFSAATLFTTYLISKELVNKLYWNLLPVFLLANTLMFVFLSGGVNYDNLANLFASLSILFLIRYLRYQNHFDLLWLAIFVLIGCLTKLTSITLGGIIFFILVYDFVKRPIRLLKIDLQTIVLFALVIVLLFLNVALHIGNLRTFGTIRPDCEDIFTETECELSPFVQREKKQALPAKLTLPEAVKAGYPEPIRYAFKPWAEIMVSRIYGILGHKGYFPTISIYFHMYLIIMAAICFRYLSRDRLTVSLVILFLLYVLSILIVNYDAELFFGFKHITLQGRYLFPVWGLLYVLFTTAYIQIKRMSLRAGLLILTVLLFFVGGPIKFILYNDWFFSSWMW